MSVDENKLGTENIKKLLFSMAVPAIAAQIINVLYNMVDRMFIGRIPGVGALALTGVGVTFPLIMLVAAFAALVSMGGAPRASIMMGKGDKDEAEKILGNSASALIIVSIILTGIILLFGEPILMFFGASQDTIVYALDYMNIYAIGTIFVQISLGLNAFITAQGFSKVSMQTILIGAVLNIILDPILIFKLNMGVKGAALATIISQGVSAIWVLKFLTSDKSNIRLKKENLKLDKRIIVPSITLGLSPFIMQATESILAVVFNKSLQKYGGDIAVGTMTILSSVMQFSMLPLLGLTQGSQPIISYNYGSRNTGRVKDTITVLVKCSLAYSVGLWAFIMFKPEIFVGIFTKDQALMAMAIPSLRLFMSMSFLFGIQIACQQTFIALGNARTSIFLALLRKLILLIPLIYIIPIFMENKVKGVFLAEPISDTIAVVITFTLFIIQFKKILEYEDDEKDNYSKESYIPAKDNN